MKLLQEADLDAEFNRHMGKIQDAIEALEKLAPKFKSENLKPVPTQRMALEVAADDLKALKGKMFP